MYDTVESAEAPHFYGNHIICVGAVYIDTILTYALAFSRYSQLTNINIRSVPHFPIEDEKLRAKSLKKQRGGNTANSLEILSQLLEHDPNPQWRNKTTGLHLLAVLPSWGSSATEFIKDSLPDVMEDGYIYRSGHQEAASSYIIKSQATRSRTIVSINQLPEMQLQEFKAKVSAPNIQLEDTFWIHFEGRVPDILLECVQWLRTEHPKVKFSVECEKPERTGMAEVAKYADIVFYSRLWGEKNGYEDAKSFLDTQKLGTRDGAVLCCTWGAGGATAVKKGKEEIWADVKAWQAPDEEKMEVVDTIGAGDTFVAGMLFAVTNHEEWPLQQKLKFANQIAGRKVVQEGFGDLGSKMW
jgi:ketohexokinase